VNDPTVVIVIVAYNSADVIADLLDSIPAASTGLTTRTVVVDNGSTDKTVKIVGERDDCLLIESTNVGYSGGINRGITEGGEADAVLVLNPDMRLLPGAISELYHALVSQPDAGIVAPQVRYPDGTLHLSLRRTPSLGRSLGLNATKWAPLAEYVHAVDAYLEPHTVDWALGAALMLSRQCLDAVGPWDESYFLQSEETDYQLRAHDAGFATWYVPSAVVIHIGQGSGYSPKVHCMQVVNRVRCYRRRHGPVASYAYYALNVLSETSWIIRGSAQSRQAVAALLLPSRRPAELNASHALLPS
jgi:GT2 family glycosyltransferase